MKQSVSDTSVLWKEVMVTWQPPLFDLTEMSALKDGVVQEWGLKSLFSVSALAARGAYVYQAVARSQLYRIEWRPLLGGVQCDWPKTSVS